MVRASGDLQQTVPCAGGFVFRLAFTHNRRWLVCLTQPPSTSQERASALTIWDLEQKREVGVYRIQGPDTKPDGIAAARTGRTVVAALGVKSGINGRPGPALMPSAIEEK
jgi:hypothetical protein